MVLGDFSRIKWEKARFFKQKGQYREAEEELKEALDDDSENLLLRASLAEVYLRQDRTLEARILAESILSVDPQHSKALSLLGEIAFKEKRLDEALASFRQAADHNPAPYLILRVARTLREMRRYGQALETLDAVLLKDKNNLLFLKEKALILNRLKRLDEALSVYERIGGLDPRDPFVRKEIYRLRGLKRQDQKVIRELETVVNLPSRKDDPHLHGLLGDRLKKAGRFREAIAEFQIASRLDPKNPYYLKQEGFCHNRLGAFSGAIRTLSEAFRKDPGDFYTKSTLKKLYAQTNNNEEFISLLEEVLVDHPQQVKLVSTLKQLKKHSERSKGGKPNDAE